MADRADNALFTILEDINRRPEPFQITTTRELWTDPFLAERMLEKHLDPDIDAASRKTAFIERSVNWIRTRFQIDSRTTILDLGCGPGLYTHRLAAAGARVTGIDFSEHSLGYARDQAAAARLDIDYIHQDYLEYETQATFGLVMMIMCDFSVLNPAQRARLLRKIHGQLRPGGHFLFDAYSLAAYASRREGASYARDQLDGFWAPNSYYGFCNTCKYDAQHVILDKYTIIEREQIRTIYNWLQYFDPEALCCELTQHGFVVETLHGDVAGAPFDAAGPEFTIIAAKP